MSVKMIVTCDYCGKEITGRIGHITFDYHKDNSPDSDLAGEKNPTENKDFCERCMKNVIKTLLAGAQKPKEVKLDQPDAPIDDTKGYGSKTIVDHDMICNLHRTGWPVKDIALDQHCTPQTVVNHLKKEGLWKKDEKESDKNAEADQLPDASQIAEFTA